MMRNGLSLIGAVIQLWLFDPLSSGHRNSQQDSDCSMGWSHTLNHCLTVFKATAAKRCPPRGQGGGRKQPATVTQAHLPSDLLLSN
jgi:hypothetical protein